MARTVLCDRRGGDGLGARGGSERIQEVDDCGPIVGREFQVHGRHGLGVAVVSPDRRLQCRRPAVVKIGGGIRHSPEKRRLPLFGQRVIFWQRDRGRLAVAAGTGASAWRSVVEAVEHEVGVEALDARHVRGVTDCTADLAEQGLAALGSPPRNRGPAGRGSRKGGAAYRRMPLASGTGRRSGRARPAGSPAAPSAWPAPCAGCPDRSRWRKRRRRTPPGWRTGPSSRTCPRGRRGARAAAPVPRHPDCRESRCRPRRLRSSGSGSGSSWPRSGRSSRRRRGPWSSRSRYGPGRTPG